MASRIQIPLVVQTRQVVKTGGSPAEVTVICPVNNASVEVKRRDEKPVKVYESEAGAEISNKLKTDENGQFKAWVEEGPYTITAEGGTPSIVLTTYSFDALPGRGVEQTAKEVVTKADLTTELASFLVPIGTVLNYGGEPGSPPTGFFTCDGTKKKIAEYPLLAAKLKSKYGAETGTEFFLPNGEGKNSNEQKFVQIIRHD